MFTLGFEKIADNAASGGSSSQGLPFSSADTNNATSNVGPGGMTPAGIDSYQPAPKKPEEKKEKKKMDSQELAQFFMHKGASAGERVTGRKMDNGTGGDSYIQGYKYESSTTDATPTDVMDSLKAEKARRKAYVKASLK